MLSVLSHAAFLLLGARIVHTLLGHHQINEARLKNNEKFMGRSVTRP